MLPVADGERVVGEERLLVRRSPLPLVLEVDDQAVRGFQREDSHTGVRAHAGVPACDRLEIAGGLEINELREVRGNARRAAVRLPAGWELNGSAVQHDPEI